MGIVNPIFASESKAAKLMDMKIGEFRELVKLGLLPPPCRVGDFERWEVDQLKAVASGNAIDGSAEIKW